MELEQQHFAAVNDHASIDEGASVAHNAQKQLQYEANLNAQLLPEFQGMVPEPPVHRDKDHERQQQQQQQEEEEVYVEQQLQEQQNEEQYPKHQDQSVQQQEQSVTELQAIQQQRQQYTSWFHSYVLQQAGVTSGTELLALSDIHAAHSISTLISNMQEASTTYAYVSSMKYWAEQVRELERSLRAIGPGFPKPHSSDPDAHKAMFSTAIQALSTCLQAADYAKYYAPSSEKHPALADAAATVDGRMQQCRYELYTRLTDDINAVLEACGWPPPLAPHSKQAPGHSQVSTGVANGYMSPMPLPSEEDATHGRTQQQPSQHTGSAADEQNAVNSNNAATISSFTGFDSDQARYSQLLTLLACLTSLQQVCEAKAFTVATSQQGLGQQEQQQGQQRMQPEQQSLQQHMELPLLWAAQVLAAPLQARLQSHFQPHTAAGRLDQPRWLFRVVIGLLESCTPAVAVLQPALEAAGLGGHCHMALEWARAMRDACKMVLRTARLPALVQLWEEQKHDTISVWSSYVDAMLEFEREMSPHLGGPANLQAGSPLPDALLPGSVLGAVTQEPTCMAAWLAVQRGAALRTLETAAQQPDAWQAEPDDSMADGPTIGGESGLGSLKEFAPPRVALLVYSQLHSLVALSQHAPTADDQRALLDQVGGDLLQRTAQLLASHLQQTSTWPGLASVEGAPVAGACVSAARYLHHMASELLVGPGLHRLHSSRGRAVDGTVDSLVVNGDTLPGSITSTPAAVPSHWARSVSPSPLRPSPVRSTDDLARAATPGLLGDVVVQHSFTPAAWDPPVLAAAVAHLGALHREWCLRIAHELANLFGKGASDYMEQVSTSSQYPTHSGAAGTVTPALLHALTSLQVGLHALCGPLDGPSFRDIWRAVAVPINRLLFNRIATEATFDSAGAQQFGVDCNAVAAVFAPYTRRPASHFREALAAVKVLQLADDAEQVAAVVRVASQLAVSGTPLYRHPWLSELGLGCLTPAQLLAVLEQRF